MKPKRGGKREGSGRKATGVTRVKLSVTVSIDAGENIRRVAELRGTTVSAIADELFLSIAG